MQYKIPADQRCALISRAIEIDLRNIIKDKILPFVNLKDLIDEKILKKIQERIVKESKENLNILDEVKDIDIIENFDYGTSLQVIK